MCLKRYSMSSNGKAIRLNTYIDIPIEIGLPHFIQDDTMAEEGPLYGNFKLSLQAVVCHRGNSVDSGHYIALVRGTSSNATPPPPGSSDSTSIHVPNASEHWMRFDDLAAERITLVNIEQALKEESPYLLFYQIVPVDEEGEETSLRNNRASYTDPEDDVDVPVSVQVSSVASTDDDQPEMSISGSARPSFEITSAYTEDPQTGQPGRGESIALSDSLQDSVREDNSGGLQPNPVAVADPSTPKGEGGRGSFSLSRRSSRRLKSRSRSGGEDQGSEKRLSAAFSRFANLRLSREKLVSDPNSAAVTEDSDEPTTKEAGSLGEDNAGKLTPSTSENRQKETSRERKIKRGKQPDRLSRMKTGKQPERECLVM
jgi:hypothetical protein